MGRFSVCKCFCVGDLKFSYIYHFRLKFFLYEIEALQLLKLAMDRPRRVARKIVVDKAPNRLFVKYLTEWKDRAKERGDKSAHTYGRALKSLKKYPLPLQCGEEAKILEHIGDKICKMLDNCLEKDADENGMTAAEYLAKSRKVPDSWWEKVNQEIPGRAVSKKPAKRRKTQKTIETVRPKANKQITIDKAFSSSPETASSQENVDLTHDSASSIMTSDETFSLFPGQFDIVLCVDTRETMGSEKRIRNIKSELEKQNMYYDQRTLNLGDFLWIAQEKSEFCCGQKPKELVLDYIVERKVIADLSMSMQDGRFREQKTRLKNSGIKNIVYLIENVSTIGNQSIPEQTLRQAIYNTQIIDRINVKYTKNAKSTVFYLDIMTKQLRKLYGNCVLRMLEDTDSQEFSESGAYRLPTFVKFNKIGSKQRKLTIKELFLRQLMQIHGMSYHKAFSITNIYETPIVLVQKYNSLESDVEKEALLSNIKFGLSERNIGIALSRAVHVLFS